LFQRIYHALAQVLLRRIRGERAPLRRGSVCPSPQLPAAALGGAIAAQPDANTAPLGLPETRQPGFAESPPALRPEPAAGDGLPCWFADAAPAWTGAPGGACGAATPPTRMPQAGASGACSGYGSDPEELTELALLEELFFAGGNEVTRSWPDV
jgi:hypothetical protein